MAYDNNARNKTLYQIIFYVLNIGPNDNGTGHLIFKLSTKQILTVLKYRPVPMPEDLIKAINEIDTIATNIQIDQFYSDHYITQEDYFNNTQNDNQDHCDNMDNSEHESDNELDSS